MMKNASGERQENGQLPRAPPLVGRSLCCAAWPFEERTGRMASWSLNSHNWSFAWKEGRRQMDACGLDGVIEHLTNFSLGLLPGFSIDRPISFRPKPRLSIGFRAAMHIFYHIRLCRASKPHRNAKLLGSPSPNSHTFCCMGYDGGIQATMQTPYVLQEGLLWIIREWDKAWHSQCFMD